MSWLPLVTYCFFKAKINVTPRLNLWPTLHSLFRGGRWCPLVYRQLPLPLFAHLYITKSWSVAFNVAALMLRHISCHVILFFFSFLKYNLSYNFKMVFTIFSPINAAHYLFIYFHCHPKINPAHYLFIYFHYHPIINPVH